MDWTAIAISLKIATINVAILAIFAVPLAMFLARRSDALSVVAESLLSLPSVLPPTVLGFYLLLLFRSVHLNFTFSGLVAASLICNLPFALQSFLGTFQNFERPLLEASYSLGESELQTFRRVILPLAWPGLLSGLILVFVHSLGEFGVLLMVGGNIPGVTRTLSMSLYDQVQSFDLWDAHMTAFVLLTFCLGALVAMGYLRKRMRVRR